MSVLIFLNDPALGKRKGKENRKGKAGNFP